MRKALAWGMQDIKFNVHAHPTLSEVLDELFKGAHIDTAPSKVHALAPSVLMLVLFRLRRQGRCMETRLTLQLSPQIAFSAEKVKTPVTV